MKQLLILSLGLALFIACKGDKEDDPCEQQNYVGTYVGSKKGSTCNDNDNYTFTVQAIADTDQIVIDGETVDWLGCSFKGSESVAGIATRSFEGTFDGETLRMESKSLAGLLGCTWEGVKQ